MPQVEGWSPGKLESLKFFLSSSGPAPARQEQAAPAPPSGPASAYLGLKYLLRSGPSGIGAPSTWMQAKQGTALPISRDGGRATTSARFAPYTLQPPKALPAARWEKLSPGGGLYAETMC